MKIAFVGKGGSGKTTVSGLLSRHLAAQELPVLAIDADINQHLARTLGMSEEDAQTIPAMGLEIDRIKTYLRGTNTRVPDNASMLKTTPPGLGSQLLRVAEVNPLYGHFMREVSGIRIMAVGPFSEDDLGVRCYHSKTGSVELILNHLVDTKDEYVIVDMTAGADSFSSGLFTRFDVTFLVVEPTVKSLSVYEQYKAYARDHDVRICVIGNKISCDEDRDFLIAHTENDLIASFGQSQFVKMLDRGTSPSFDTLEPENQDALMRIFEIINSTKKNWEKFYRQAVEFHIKNAESWGSKAAGKDITTQIDPDFSYPP